MVLPNCHAGMDPGKEGTPCPILLQSRRKMGPVPIPTFLRCVPVKDDPGQVESGDGPEAGEHKVNEEQQADDPCGSRRG